MFVTCDRQLLCDAVSSVSRAVPGKSTIPALEGILLNATENTLTLSGYDLELGITTKIASENKKPGRIILNAKLFSEMTKHMAGDQVTIQCDEKLLTTIRCGNSEFNILGMDANDFPELPNAGGDQQLEIRQKTLKNMIRQTLFATAITDQKPILTGSLFDLKDGFLKVVSIDGFRLALRKEKIACTDRLKFVVPGKTLSELSKLLSDDEEKTLSIQIGPKHIVFVCGAYNVISRLLEGEFLDYDAAIPASSLTTVRVDAKKFTESIERIALLITDRLKSPIRCEFTQSKIAVSCSTAIGKAFDELAVDLSGEAVSIGFNSRYLTDALKACECEEVKIESSGPLSPMKIVPVSGEDFLFLVLPVRLKNEN